MIKHAPRQIFTVFIRDQEYDVYSIDEKKHAGLNGMPETWWIYYSSRLPEGALPPIDSPSLKPFNKGIIRSLWDIRIKQHNSSKEKWGDTDFRNSISVEMWCNNKRIYGFVSGGSYLSYAFAKVQYLQVQLAEHPYDFFDAKKENGRKIYWYGLPATVKVKSSTWEIGIVPDYTIGLTKEEWWKELKSRKTKLGTAVRDENDDFDDEMDKTEDKSDMNDDYINWGDALSDQHIDWFRK